MILSLHMYVQNFTKIYKCIDANPLPVSTPPPPPPLSPLGKNSVWSPKPLYWKCLVASGMILQSLDKKDLVRSGMIWQNVWAMRLNS